jgi:class 3 adenylate cyclase
MTGSPDTDVRAWLSAIDLERYASVFANNDIDGETLFDLTDEDLRELGVSLGHRKKILKAISTRAAAIVTERPPAPAPVAEAPRDRERRQITIMFCDLVGSTELATTVDPDALDAVYQTYYRLCSDIVRRFDGYIAGIAGDGLNVLFGYPKTGDGIIEKALGAGLAIAEKMAATAFPAGKGAPLDLKVRIGIATGSVIVGHLTPSAEGTRIDAVGATPNLAARLQELAPPNGLIVDETSHGLAGSLFEFESLGPVHLKGFENPVPAFRVIKAGLIRDRFEALGRVRSAFLGRRRELDQLVSIWQSTVRGAGMAIAVIGEAGIGKSHLIYAFDQTVSEDQAAIIRLQCSPLSTNSTLQPIIDFIEAEVGGAQDTAAEARLVRLGHFVGGDKDPVTMALFADLLAFEGEAVEPIADMAPAERREALLGALADILIARAGDRPTLVQLEDFHWADATTIEFFDRLAAGARATGLMVLVTSRPEAADHWPLKSDRRRLELDVLSEAECREIIDTLAGERPLPAAVKRQIIAKAGGNPLFLEELTHSVLDSQATEDGASAGFAAADDHSRELPASLNEILTARLDRLSGSRTVAQIAAVLGRTFDHSLLQETTDHDDNALRDAIKELIEAGIIQQRSGHPNPIYAFKHALVQDAVYQTMILTQRADLHGRVADVMIARYPEVALTRADLLAHHLTEAGRAQEAVPYWQRAGGESLQHSANFEAEHHLRMVLELLPGLADDRQNQQHELDAVLALAGALRVTRGYAVPEVGTLCERGRALAQALASENDELSALNGLYSFHVVRAEHAAAEQAARDLLAVAVRLGDETYEMIGNRAVGVVGFHVGKIPESLEKLTDSLERYDIGRHMALTRRFGADHAEICASYLALAQWVAGDPNAARATADWGVGHSEAIDHPHSLAQALVFRAVLGSLMRNPVLMEASVDLLLAICRDHGFAFLAAGGRFFGSFAKFMVDTNSGHIATMIEDLERWQTMAPGNFAPYIHLLVADAKVDVGDFDGANQHLETATEIQERVGERWSESEIERVSGRLVLATGDQAAAEAAFRQAVATAASHNAGMLQVRAATDLARLLVDTNRQIEATDALVSARSALASSDGGWDFQRADAVIAG